MRARIWSAVAWGSGGPPQVWRSSLWMTPCGWLVRWLHAPTRPLSSLRSAARAWRLTGGGRRRRRRRGAGGTAADWGCELAAGLAARGWRPSGPAAPERRGQLGVLALAEQGPDLVRFEQAGQAEEVLLLGRTRRGGRAELAAVVQHPVEVRGGVEGLEGRARLERVRGLALPLRPRRAGPASEVSPGERRSTWSRSASSSAA